MDLEVDLLKALDFPRRRKNDSMAYFCLVLIGYCTGVCYAGGS